MPVYRRAPIIGVKILWNALKSLTTPENHGSIKQEELVIKVISSGHFVSENIVRNVVDDAINDGLIIKSDEGLLQLPSNSRNTKYLDDTPDWYCYECHTGGNVQKCQSCLRVFHIACIVTDAEKQALWSKLDYHKDKERNTLTYREVEIDDETSGDQTQNDTIKDDSKLRQFCYGCRLIHKGKNSNETIKSRLAGMSKEELHYLLSFAYNRVHSWIMSGTFTLQDKSMPKASYILDNVDLSISNLLRFPTTIETLKVKIENQQYTVFEEFLRDILDIGHNLALVFGRHSAEYEATNYLFADAQFEIGEIKTCRDCYRHSNEKFDNYWFTIPCVTREHDLVYAKSPGFSYWPAKVIKINEGMMYDVRFFGGEHSRAIVAAKNVEVVDENIKKLNKKIGINGNQLSKPLRTAINELREYQKRCELPRNSFTFEAEKEIRENNTCKYEPVPSKRPRVTNRRSTSSVTSSRNSLEKSQQPKTKPCPLQKKSLNAQNEAMKDTNESQPIIDTNHEIPKKVPESPVQINIVQKRNGPAPKRVKLERERKLMEVAENSTYSLSENKLSPSSVAQQKKSIKHPALTKLDARLIHVKSVEEAHQVAATIMQEEIECFQKKIKHMEAKHKEEIRETKRNQWCKNCYEYANYYCCWNTSYCSKECQRSNWDQHKRHCKRIATTSNNNHTNSKL